MNIEFKGTYNPNKGSKQKLSGVIIYKGKKCVISDGKVEKCENYNDSRLCGVGDENGLGEIDGINSGTANTRGKGQDQGQNINNTLPIFTTM